MIECDFFVCVPYYCTCNSAKPDPFARNRTSLVSEGRIRFCIIVGLVESTFILLTVFKYVYCKLILLFRSVNFNFLLISLRAVTAIFVSIVDAKPENDDIQDSWRYLTNYIKIIDIFYKKKQCSSGYCGVPPLEFCCCSSHSRTGKASSSLLPPFPF